MSLIVGGGSELGNRRPGPLPSLALNPWETLCVPSQAKCQGLDPQHAWDGLNVAPISSLFLCILQGRGGTKALQAKLVRSSLAS